MKKYAQSLVIGLLGLAFFACSDSTESKSEDISHEIKSGDMLKDNEIGLRKVDLQDEKDVKLLQYAYDFS